MDTPPSPEMETGHREPSYSASNVPQSHGRAAPDTVVLYNTDMFDSLGIQEIPLPEFVELADLIGRAFGIRLGENKRTLVTGRIHPMLEKYGFSSHRAFLDAIYNDTTGELLSELANRISTNHTAFYREDAHFGILNTQVLSDLTARKKARGDRDLRIWCAACATGEEAYTILFVLLRYLNIDYHNWHAGVLATDISAEALDFAKAGIYQKSRLEPVPPEVLMRYFDRLDETTFEVKPEYRKEVTFRRLNLMNDSYPFRQPFDIIFCRNVMIYFSRRNRTQLLGRLFDWLVPGGYLFIGHSESLVGTYEGYEYVAPAVYRRADSDAPSV